MPIEKRERVDVKKDVTKPKKTGPEEERWSAEDLGEQSSYEGKTEMKRRLLRADETQADPDVRDVAGATPKQDTPHGRSMGEHLQPARTNKDQKKRE